MTWRREPLRIGVDVGGTNTDAVVMSGTVVVAAHKTATTTDVTSGIEEALRSLADAFSSDDVQAVMIGTTHFTNAFIEASDLARCGVIRLGTPAARAIPPFADWPRPLVDAIGGQVYECHGGHEFDGRRIAPIDTAEIRAAAEQLGEAGITSVAIAGIFSPIASEDEVEAAAVVAEALPDAHLTLSHEIGRIGLLERENATIINASLRPVAERITGAFTEALRRLDIGAPLYISQNDGTLLGVDAVRRFPALTFASGPTNSMRGAAMLSGLDDCLVVDVGGTTTDIGVIANGFPRPAGGFVDLAGVRTNFRMPDVASVGIGGGSLVTADGGRPRVGPKSVGHRLRTEGLVFGGRTLTATDVAVAAGLCDVGDANLVAHLRKGTVSDALTAISAEVSQLADQMKASLLPIPWVLVGGGSVVLPSDISGSDPIVRPAHYPVANAVGAAIAQIGGEVDRVVWLSVTGREATLDALKQEASDRAVAAGADPSTIDIVDIDEIPLTYLPGDAVRVRVKAVGDLAYGCSNNGPAGA